MVDPELVTSSNFVYWGRYGRRLAESFLKYTFSPVSLYLYHEASKERVTSAQYLPEHKRIFKRDLFVCAPALHAFLEAANTHVRDRLGFVPSSHPDERLGQRGYNYLWDAVTFSKKGFALAHALRSTRSSLLCWVDADVVFRKAVPTGIFERLVGEFDVAYFGRFPQHSETGFIAFNLRSTRTLRFVEDYASIWENWSVFEFLDGWTDCHVFDAALRKGERYGLKARNLSTQANGHVIASSPFGGYIDHQKGPRKQKGFSPERCP